MKITPSRFRVGVVKWYLNVLGIFSLWAGLSIGVQAADDYRFTFDLKAHQQTKAAVVSPQAAPTVQIDGKFDQQAWVNHGNEANSRWPADIDALNTKLAAVVKEDQDQAASLNKQNRFKYTNLAGYFQTYHM